MFWTWECEARNPPSYGGTKENVSCEQEQRGKCEPNPKLDTTNMEECSSDYPPADGKKEQYVSECGSNADTMCDFTCKEDHEYVSDAKGERCVAPPDYECSTNKPARSTECSGFDTFSSDYRRSSSDSGKKILPVDARIECPGQSENHCFVACDPTEPANFSVQNAVDKVIDTKAKPCTYKCPADTVPDSDGNCIADAVCRPSGEVDKSTMKSCGSGQPDWTTDEKFVGECPAGSGSNPCDYGCNDEHKYVNGTCQPLVTCQ